LSGYPPYDEVKKNDLIQIATERLNIGPDECSSDSPIHQFLANVEYLPSTGPHDKTGGLLTPNMTELLPENIYQLDKESPGSAEDYKNMISLFYGEDAAATDRLVFDYCTGLAIWEEDYPSHVQPHHQLRWGPLEFFLVTWLNDWKSGRYYWEATPADEVALGDPPFELKMNHWISEDLEAAIISWNDLLETIESRMPNPTRRRLPPVSRRALRKATFDSFSYAFLLRAERPTFKFVGPGLTTVSDDVVGKSAIKQFDDPSKATKKAENPNFGRLVSNTTTSDENMSGYILCGRAGLYSCPKMILGNYWLTFFHPGDRKVLDYIFLNQDMSMNVRGGATSLNRIFDKWRELIEAGIWEVNDDGVSTQTEWLHNEENVKLIVILS
jgi:hypothetical protein